MTNNNEVEKELKNRIEVLARVKIELRRAQERMKRCYNESKTMSALRLLIISI